MRTVHVSNTLTGTKDVLPTGEDGSIGIYACGVTTYDHCHLGHAMQAIFFDVMRKYLRYAGYNVTYVRNYTDVDDKVIQRAAESGQSPAKLSADMVASCQRDMKAIGVEPADHEPKVSEHIPEIIELIEDLIKADAAYATEGGNVYYRVRSKPDYGKLSRQKPDELRSGTRLQGEEDKQDELDFALWKKDDIPEASWESPWGLGRPGWHIECSAMAKKYLGKTFALHGGGRDLVFPHHENEIAQSESGNQAPFAHVWVHSGLLTIDDQKMSKSLGNHITIADFLKDWPAEVMRYSFLQNHFASNINFAKDAFHKSLDRLHYYYATLAALKALAPDQAEDAAAAEEIREEFHAAMADDFNTCSALAAMNRHFKKANEWLASNQKPAPQARVWLDTLTELGQVLGLFCEEPTAFQQELQRHLLPQLGISEEQIDQKIAERRQARADKDYAAADRLRDDLAQQGIELMDQRDGTTWSIKRQWK